jgi:hypothetical protein
MFPQPPRNLELHGPRLGPNHTLPRGLSHTHQGALGDEVPRGHGPHQAQCHRQSVQLRMGTQPAAETEGKGQGVLQPEAKRDEAFRGWDHPELSLPSPCLPYRRGVPRDMNMAQGRNKGMVKKTRISEGKKNLRLGTTLPPPPPQGSRDGDIRPWRPGGSSGASLDQACSRTTFHLGPSWLLPIWLYPPSSETKYVLILLPSSTGTLAPITLGWEGWRSPGSKGYGSALPPAPPAHADSS